MTAGTGMTDSGVTVMTGVATTNATCALTIEGVPMNAVVQTIEGVPMSIVVQTTGEVLLNAVVLMGVAILTGEM